MRTAMVWGDGTPQWAGSRVKVLVWAWTGDEVLKGLSVLIRHSFKPNFPSFQPCDFFSSLQDVFEERDND